MSAQTTIVLDDNAIPFPDGVDYEIRDGVLTIYTQTQTRHYGPGRWREVRESTGQ